MCKCVYVFDRSKSVISGIDLAFGGSVVIFIKETVKSMLRILFLSGLLSQIYLFV